MSAKWAPCRPESKLAQWDTVQSQRHILLVIEFCGDSRANPGLVKGLRFLIVSRIKSNSIGFIWRLIPDPWGSGKVVRGPPLGNIAIT